MLDWIALAAVGMYGAGTLYSLRSVDPLGWRYSSPEETDQQLVRLVHGHPGLCEVVTIGQSTEARPIKALRLHGRDEAGTHRARLLITANIHAVEYIGGYVARAVARKLLDGYGRTPHITDLLDRADVWMVPLLNPDGAARIWRRKGFDRLRNLRHTANGVDPNRNFPFVAAGPHKGWNSASNRPGSAYYCGPHPLSEPECLALARLCKRKRFCAAVNFHSFGGVVFMPAITGGDGAQAARALAAFDGFFQTHQPRVKYRPIPERSLKIQGQLDPFLLNAFGTASVTVEVGRLGLRLLKPWCTFNPFWWANPDRPDDWVRNDVDATIHTLSELLSRTGGRPCTPAQPELADIVPD
jgi:Zinc carboxypeptidase